MADVLDALLAYLQRAQPGAATPAGGLQVDPNAPYTPLPPMDWDAVNRAIAAEDAQRRAALPPGLPAAVTNSIVNRPDYGETQRMPGRQWPTDEPPQSEAYLAQQLAEAREMQRLRALGLPYAAATTQFASPLNQMMPRWGSRAVGL